MILIIIAVVAFLFFYGLFGYASYLADNTLPFPFGCLDFKHRRRKLPRINRAKTDRIAHSLGLTSPYPWGALDEPWPDLPEPEPVMTIEEEIERKVALSYRVPPMYYSKRVYRGKGYYR